MNTISIIARKEIIVAYRSKAYLFICTTLLALVIITLWSGYRQYRNVAEERNIATANQRQKWLQQDPKHPHIAAHFGNFAYMPKTALSLFDQGLDSFTGTVVYLEPHKQNDFSFKPAEEQGAALRFGELSAALVMQVVFPLLVIFLCFNTFSQEFEQQTIRLLYAQGVSFRQIFAGKFIGQAILSGSLILPVFAGIILFLVWVTGDGSAILAPTLLLSLLYTFYLLLFIALSLLLSAYLKNGKKTLLTLICLWAFVIIILPKWAANTGNNLYQLPSKGTFNANIRTDILKGINGHDASGERAEKIKQKLLLKYQVDTISKLPFNFEGYIMEAGEEYSSKVYDRHFAGLQHILIKQNQVTQWCSLIDPYIAVNNLSMALSGTDYFAHLDFQQQAEQYRRHFVQQMNHDMEVHSKLGDWDYKAGKSVFAGVAPFVYRSPGLLQSTRHYLPGLASLFIWGFLIFLFTSRYPSYLN